MPSRPDAPEVRVLATAEAALEVVLQELHALGNGPARALVSFATGATFAPLLARLDAESQAGRLGLEALFATHLDEYLGFAPDQAGGMVHELCAHSTAIAAMLRRGTFVPVPGDGRPPSLRAHEARLQQLGGIALQLLGIGRNGHIAFNEPGCAFETGFHVAELAAETRADAQRRFHPAPVPTHGVTAGIASILHSRRIVLCAFGAGKAAAVRAMLQGEVATVCPAAALRRHRNVLVLLDPAAASGLGNAAASGS